MIIAIYKDDGPANGCGQDAMLTAPREEVHTFPTYEDFRHADYALLKSGERREARYIKWYEAPDTIPRATVAAAFLALEHGLRPELFRTPEAHAAAMAILSETRVQLGILEDTL